MEEHFNENYIESEKYPKATLKGSIQDFELSALKDGPNHHTLIAALTLHGKTKNLEIPIVLTATDEKLVLTSNFALNPDDFDISIPNIVRSKVAKEVDVNVHLELSN